MRPNSSIKTLTALRALLLGAWLWFTSGPVLADGGWTLLSADLKQSPVSLQSMDDSGVSVVPIGAGAGQRIGYESFLQVDRPGAATSSQEKFVLVGAGGEKLFGQPTGYKNERVIWMNALVGEMSISLKNVRALLRNGKVIDDADANRTQDVILLANGDSVKGIVSDIAPPKVKISANATEMEVPLDTIAAILFAPAGKPDFDSGRAFRIRLADGSSVTARQVASAGDELKLTMHDKSRRAVRLSAVVGIEQLNGPVSWLSSRPPEAVVQVPYFGNISWPTRMDLTVGGKPITFGGRTYARGIGVHSYSRIDYALDGAYEAFRTQYAIASDTKTQYADVTVRIKLDGKIVHEQQHVRADALWPPVIIDIPKDAKLLTLEVDYGDANDTQDHFNWIEPALLRTKPAVQPPPAPPPATRPAIVGPTTQPTGA